MTPDHVGGSEQSTVDDYDSIKPSTDIATGG
jgi:hypothetical protein